MTSLTGYSELRPLGAARDTGVRGRATSIVLWVLQIGAAGMILLAGSLKLLGSADVVQMFATIGLGQWFRYLTGAIEVTSGLLLLVPSLAFFGAAALVPTMIGAIVTHVFVIGGNPAPAIGLLIATTAVAWMRRPNKRTLLMAIQILGTTALVTGANRGIGRALVEALLERGAARVYATARRPEALGDLVARFGDRIVALQLDVTRTNEVRAAAARAPDVRILINNAGVVAKFGGELTDASWIAAARDEFEVNVLGTWSVTQAFAPALAGRTGAAVVNIGSVAGLAAFPAVASYSGSKAALHSLTQATRALLGPQGVHVAGVYPGPIDTDMARSFEMAKTAPADAAHAILAGIEAGREEIFPDPASQEWGALFLRDPKTLEQMFAAANAVSEAD